MAFPIDTAIHALSSASRYCAQRPVTLFRIARHALGARLAIPLDALRWAVGQLDGGPRDVTIAAHPPAIHLGATVEKMGATVRAQISIAIDDLRLGPETLQITVKLSELDLELIGDSSSPAAALIKSGALDLTKPGKLAKMVPTPPAIVSITDDEIVIDLMRVPGLAQNASVKKLLRLVTPVANIAEISTVDDMLVVGLDFSPLRLPAALIAATRA